MERVWSVEAFFLNPVFIGPPLLSHRREAAVTCEFGTAIFGM